MVRTWSDHELVSGHWPVRPILNRKLQHLALKCCACHEKWRSDITKCCACREKWPGTKNDSHDWSFSHMKHHLQCAEQQDSYSNITKYCICLTELLLDWTVTLLSCCLTEPLLCWIVSWLSCYFPQFFAFLNLRNSEVSHLNFLRSKYNIIVFAPKRPSSLLNAVPYVRQVECCI